jgi:hypothetical protein
MTRVAIDIRVSLLMTIQTPFHIVPIAVHHLPGSLGGSGNPVTSRAVNIPFYMNPVRKDDMGGKFIHPPPGNLFAFLHILNDFQGLRPLAHRIGCMTHPTEFNIRDPCHPKSFDIPVAERAVQFGNLFMMDVIEENRLVNGLRGVYRKERKEEAFGLNLKPMVSHSRQEKEEYCPEEKKKLLLHILLSIFDGTLPCQVKLGRAPKNSSPLSDYTDFKKEISQISHYFSIHNPLDRPTISGIRVI